MQVVDLTQEAASDPVTNCLKQLCIHMQCTRLQLGHMELQIQHQAEATADSLAQVRQHSAACVEHVLFDH